MRADIRGSIPANAKAMLARFSINDEAWVTSESQFEHRFGYAIGAVRALKHYTHNLSKYWLRGQRAIQQL